MLLEHLEAYSFLGFIIRSVMFVVTLAVFDFSNTSGHPHSKVSYSCCIMSLKCLFVIAIVR